MPTENSLSSLQYAAEGGHALAQWKLGRMYAEGDGVQHDDLRAFEYFSRIANPHADDSPPRRRRALSPMPLWRSATTISTAFRIRA